MAYTTLSLQLLVIVVDTILASILPANFKSILSLRTNGQALKFSEAVLYHAVMHAHKTHKQLNVDSGVYFFLRVRLNLTVIVFLTENMDFCYSEERVQSMIDEFLSVLF